MNKISAILFRPVDNSLLILFRIFFGLLLAVETAGAVFTGWVYETFIEPTVMMPFTGFEFLKPLHGYGMYVYFFIMAALGLMVMAGYYYRMAMTAFTIMWWITYVMQKFNYNNHYYLLVLISAIMIFLPAHEYRSLDVKQGRVKESLICPFWCIFIILAQLTIVYISAALAKIHPDWLEGRPLEVWFQSKQQYYLIGPLFSQLWMKWFIAYGGIAFDLFIVPLLLWRKTRLPAFIASLAFHIFNSITFGIGIFPYFMLAASVLFFPPQKIRAVFFKNKLIPDVKEKTYPVNHLVLAGMIIYLAWQIYLPLRHHLYPGNVNWTEEGHRMAWRMMLRTKSGQIHFKVKDPATGEEIFVEPRQYVTGAQYNTLATKPDVIWQFSQMLEEEFKKRGIKSPEVYAYTSVSLNGRDPQPLVDPAVNLAAGEWRMFSHSPWVLQLKE